MREMGILGMGKIKGKGGSPWKRMPPSGRAARPLAAAVAPGETFRRRGNAPAETSVLPLRRKKSRLFFARRLEKGRKPVYLMHHARNSGRRSLETEQCNLTCGAEGPFPGPSARQRKIGEPNQEET